MIKINPLGNKLNWCGIRKVLVISALLLGACNHSQPADSNNTEKVLELIVEPPVLATNTSVQTRAYNPDNLRLEVTLDGQMADTAIQADGTHRVFGIVSNTTFNIAVKWFEEISETEIQLTSFEGQKNAADGGSVVIKNSEYETTTYDWDNDGDSNLFERNNNTNPFNSNYCTTCRGDIDIHINKINPGEAPIIDGELDDVWLNLSQFKDRTGNLLIDDLLTVASDEYLNQNYTDGNSPFGWATMHDGTYLYILILGEQSPHQTPIGESTSGVGDNISVSLASISSFGEQTKAYTFYLSDRNGNPYPSALVNSDSSGGPAAMGVCLCEGAQTIWEFRIPLASVNVNDIAVGQPFQISVRAEDDIDGGDFDFLWFYAATALLRV